MRASGYGERSASLWGRNGKLSAINSGERVRCRIQASCGGLAKSRKVLHAVSARGM